MCGVGDVGWLVGGWGLRGEEGGLFFFDSVAKFFLQ